MLLDVVRAQRWTAFENIALSSHKVFAMISIATPQYDADGQSLLHFCLRKNPPLKIVRKMMEMLPNRVTALRETDCYGRTPLHVAAAFNADPMVIKYLANAHPEACTTPDQDGRTPLHLACDSSSCSDDLEEPEVSKKRPQEDEVKKSPATPSYDAVRALLSESLAASTFEDEDGMTALEYAIISDASLEVVTLLQKASMKCLQERDESSSPSQLSMVGSMKRRRTEKEDVSSSSTSDEKQEEQSAARKVSLQL